MEQKNWIKKSIAEGGLKAVAFHFIDKVLLPWGMPTLTVYFGTVNELPWFYIWLGFLLSLAAVFHWLVKMGEWRYKVSVDNKICVSDLRVLTDELTGGVGVQLQLTSMAEYPIDFRVDEFKLQIGDKVPVEVFKKVFSSIPAFGVGWKNSAAVMINAPAPNTSVNGYLEYSISYGKHGNYTHTLEGRLGILILFGANSKVSNYSWHTDQNQFLQ